MHSMYELQVSGSSCKRHPGSWKSQKCYLIYSPPKCLSIPKSQGMGGNSEFWAWCVFHRAHVKKEEKKEKKTWPHCCWQPTPSSLVVSKFTLLCFYYTFNQEHETWRLHFLFSRRYTRKLTVSCSLSVPSVLYRFCTKCSVSNGLSLFCANCSVPMVLCSVPTVLCSVLTVLCANCSVSVLLSLLYMPTNLLLFSANCSESVPCELLHVWFFSLSNSSLFCVNCSLPLFCTNCSVFCSVGTAPCLFCDSCSVSVLWQLFYANYFLSVRWQVVLVNYSLSVLCELLHASVLCQLLSLVCVNCSLSLFSVPNVRPIFCVNCSISLCVLCQLLCLSSVWTALSFSLSVLCQLLSIFCLNLCQQFCL